MRNVGIKVWSILLAISLALYVYGQSNSAVRTIVLPVEHKNLPSDVMILRPADRNIKVTLRGPAHVLGQIVQSPPSVAVRFPDEVGKSFRMVFQRSDLPIPGSVEVLSVEPPEIDYVLDTIVSKELSVVVPSFGTPFRNRELISLVADPTRVLVRGPETILAGRTEVETEPLDLRQISESGTKEIALASAGDLLTYPRRTVTVSFSVRKKLVRQEFSGVRVRFLPEERGELYSTPDEVNVVLEAERQDLENITVGSLRAVALSGDGSERTVEIRQLPDGVEVLTIDPPVVTVRGREEE